MRRVSRQRPFRRPIRSLAPTVRNPQAKWRAMLAAFSMNMLAWSVSSLRSALALVFGGSDQVADLSIALADAGALVRVELKMRQVYLRDRNTDQVLPSAPDQLSLLHELPQVRLDPSADDLFESVVVPLDSLGHGTSADAGQAFESPRAKMLAM